jgi:putative colanic acid biosynthesis acetyltransferase WcaF
MKGVNEYQDLSIFIVPSGFRKRSVITVQIWWFIQATLFKCSPQFMFGWRNFLLRAFGAKIGKGVKVRSSAIITYPWNLEIGDFTWVGDETVIYNLGMVKIGNHVAIAHRVYLCTGSHEVDKASFDIYAKEIVLHDQAWIANDVFISPGCVIHKGAVIGSRSSVFHDMPEGMICIGSPARPIKPRKGNEIHTI